MILPSGSPRQEVPPASISRAAEIVELEVGQHIKIETTPDGTEILDAVVPPGKHWSVGLVVTVAETDV